MLKSLIIKLRRKPKAVRDQVALITAIVFTLVILIVWVFSIPGQFDRISDNDSPGLIDKFREEISGNAPDFEGITSELKELATTTPESEAEVVIPNEFPTTTSDTATNTRPIRLATTSQENASNTENSQ